MGLKTNQVFGDQELDWGQTLKSGAADLAKQPLTRPPQQQSEPLNCPRCGSANTKFCYYNNYSKSQPRHFCKSCKRYWTKGGTLRDVPAGGGRKNKHSKTSKTATTTTATSATISTAPANPEPKQRHFQNLISITTDQETMSQILYEALISSSSPSLHKTTDGLSIYATRKPFLESNSTINSAGSNASAPQNPNTEFAFSNLTSMIDPTSYQSSYDHTNHYAKNLDSMEESTIAALHIPKSSSAPWPVLDTSSATDLPNHWNWNEIDALSSSADPSMAWDDVDAGIRHLENQF